MVVKKIISDMWGSIWPMVAFISIIAVTLRMTYIFKGSRKFVLHKEILSWLFIVYVLCLYYIMMRSNNIGINFMPLVGLFENITKNYEFIIHNIFIFLPLGFFSSYYLNNKKASMTFIINLIISILIEGMLYYLGRGFNIDIVILNIIGGFIGYLIYIGLMAIKGRLPKPLKSDTFINIILILLIILIVLFSLDINILNYL